MGKKKNRKSSGFGTQKVMKYIRLIALAMPAISIAMSTQSTGNKISQAKTEYFGIRSDGSIDLMSLAKGWGPFALATVVTYGIPKLAGMIRRL